MHVRDLIELAATIVTHSGTLIRSPLQLSSQAIEGYWRHSRIRHDHWARTIREYTNVCDSGSAQQCAIAWQQIKPVLEEILASEILTRVWSAAVCHWQVGEVLDEYSPIVRSTFLAHGEARNRALNVMVYGQGGTLADSVAMNRLRRRVEKWNDVLIGGLLAHADARQFAFDSKRAESYARELASSADLSQNESWLLLCASLRAAFASGIAPISVSAAANRQIAGSIMVALPAECFEGQQSQQLLWLDRLADAAQHAAGLVEDALLEDLQPARVDSIFRYDGAGEIRAPRMG